jgi:putative ABC transport system substrate-binding protein
MRRRVFIAGPGGAVAWPLAARAQQQAKPIIGVLDLQLGGPQPEFVEGFRWGLAKVGFSEGRDVTVEYYTAVFERLQALATDVVRRRWAAIIARYANAALAAKAATGEIPTAKALGLAVPLSLLASADEVIE